MSRLSDRKRTIFAIAGVVSAVALTASGCATDAVRSNNFTAPLNDFQVQISSVASAGTGESLATAVNNIQPQIEQDFKAMEAAQQFLPEELKPIAAVCIDLSKRVSAAVEAIAVAETNKSQAELDVAQPELEASIEAFQVDCVDAYNAATGVSPGPASS
jgi:hypothetical protein